MLRVEPGCGILESARPGRCAEWKEDFAACRPVKRAKFFAVEMSGVLGVAEAQELRGGTGGGSVCPVTDEAVDGCRNAGCKLRMCELAWKNPKTMELGVGWLLTDCGDVGCQGESFLVQAGKR